MPLTDARPGPAVGGTSTAVRNDGTAPRPDRRDGHHPARRRDAPSPGPVRRRWFGNWCPRPSPARRHRRTQWHRHYHHRLHVWTGSCCWWLLVLYAAVVVIASFARAAHSAKDVPVYHVRAVAGQQARLPCDISLVSDEDDDLSDPGGDSPPLDGESSLASGANVRDAVLLVLWYRDDLGTPIYSVDARLSATHTHQEYDSTSSYHLMTTGAERWSDQRVFGDRAHFHVNGDEEELKSKTNNQKKSVITTYYSSELRIDRVGVKDAIHLYRCRVDFRLAQTRNSKVNLTVIVPPDRMEIVDVATGRQLLRRQDGDGDDDGRSEASTTTTTTTVVGPYVEGSDVRVRCRVHGGKPRPRVAWFRDNRLLKPESDDADDLNDARQQDVIAVDAYATATVTTSSLTSAGGDGAEEVIEVHLTLTGLTRSDLHTELTCRAWNYFYDDEEYSIVVTDSGTTSVDTSSGREDANGEVDPSRWTLRQRQSSLTAVVHVDMNFPPLTVQILPIAGNGRYGGIDDDSHPSPFTQSSAKMTPLPVPEGGDHLAVNGGSDVQEHRQIQSLTAGRKYELPCRAYGSRPPAKLTWWMDGRRLDTTRETTSSDGNSTTSVLTFVPAKPAKPRYLREPVGGGDADGHDGRLTCRAENPQHQQQSTTSRKHTAGGGGGGDSSDDAGSPFIQSTWLLRIQYVPETQITLGTNLRADDIREGTDVYFDCTVDAVPPAYKVQWKRDGVELHHNVGGNSGSMSGSGPTTTIIISNQSLVLQGVSRREAGHYTCGAENAEGPGPHSKPIYLDVLYAPTCAPNNGVNKSAQRVVYGVAKKETVTIACHVQANPAATEYRWSFNNTVSSIAAGGGAGPASAGSPIRQRFSGVGGLAGGPSSNSSRVLTYAPRTDFDYGTVECWARNRVGTQTHPCVYHVIAAGRPDRVPNCTVVDSGSAASRNGTGRPRNSRDPGSHVFIRCTEGYDGGLPQRLWAEIREASKARHPDSDGDEPGGDLVLNVTGVDEQDRRGFARPGQDDDGKSRANAPPVKVFVARGLKPGAVYRVDVMASNAKGRAEPLTLMISIPAGTDADDKNGLSNVMNTMDVGQDPDRARNLLLEQQREQERGRRLKEDGDGGTDGNFRITRAMAVVMLVAGSLVVVACGAATFLRYSRDDNDDDDDDNDNDNDDGADDDERRRNGGGGGGGGDDGTAVGTGTMTRGLGTKTAAAAYEPSRPAGDGGRNGAGPKPPATGDVAGGGPSDASGAPIALVVPSAHAAGSPTSLTRAANPCNAYNNATLLLPNKNPADHHQSAGVRALPPCLSYHRNPDIIPAPLHMSPGAVYGNYTDPTDSMTMIMNSSTSSSPIHYNHSRQQMHQPNRYGNSASQHYNQGVMTFRRPPVNGQYYGDVGGNPQRNSLQRPDPAVTAKDVPVDFPPPQTTSSASAAAYCTLPRSSYHHHHRQHQLYYHQPVNLDAMAVEPLPVIVVPSPPLPLPSPPPQTDNKQPAALPVVNKRESAV